LNGKTKEEDIHDLLSPYGKLENVKLILDQKTQESKRFAFAYFENQDDAGKARGELNGTNLHGNSLRIDFSLTQGPHDPTPGRYLGKAARDRGRYDRDDRRDDRRDRYDDRRRDRYDDRRDRYDRYDDRRRDRYDDRRERDRY